MIRFSIPREKLEKVARDNLLDRFLLDFLAELSSRHPIRNPARVDVTRGDYDTAKRKVVYGNRCYGLVMNGRGIVSGRGVHGESASWTFYGAPRGIRLSAASVLDMRGGNNYLELHVRTEEPDREREIETLAREVFDRIMLKA